MINVHFNNIADFIESKIYFIDNKRDFNSLNFGQYETDALNNLSEKKFSAKFGSIYSFSRFEDEKLIEIIIVGVGDITKLECAKVEQLGGKIEKTLAAKQLSSAEIIVNQDFADIDGDKFAALIASGIELSAYRFTKYFSKAEEKQSKLTDIYISSNDLVAAEHIASDLRSVNKGVFLARNLVSEPSNILYPASYADEIKAAFSGLNVNIEVLGEAEMKNLGMNALLGVGLGSDKESKLVIIEYKNATDKNQKPLALVGKGVTFDTGGISLKPANGMWDMKYDMGGSAAVVGTMKALAEREAKVNAIGIVGLVENMPDGKAQRPGDIVKSMSGQTIEVLNTDAEGRLVLADALWYAQDRFDPELIIDLATLTGAIVISLADIYAGIFSNNDELANNLLKAGESSAEKVWRLPIGDEYDKMIDSPIADMKNISLGRGAGSITAAQFLQRFVNEKPWVHIDIAGMAWADKNKDLMHKGATGYGVKLLNKLIEQNYES